jgi:6,7-dimethyl-8-ribityllumazine synthase
MNKIEGMLPTSSSRKFAICATRWNEFIVSRLISGAEDAILRSGGTPDNIDLILCPGAFELPLTVQMAIKSGKYDGVIALGAVIRGETPHFEYISAEVTKGLASISLNENIPVAYGVLTCDTTEQAVERSGNKSGNKGFEAGQTVIEMINLKSKLNGE